MKLTFTQRLTSFPPILCRLLAHKGNKPVSAEDICAISNLTAIKVAALSSSHSWDTVDIGDAIRFQRGTVGAFDDGEAMQRLDDYLRKRPTLAYLRNSPDWQKLYRPMLIEWRNSYPAIMHFYIPHRGVWELLQRLTPLHKGQSK